MMAFHSDNDSAVQQTWSSASTREDPGLFASANMKEMINQVVRPEERGISWYSKAIAAVERRFSSGECYVKKHTI
jgi:hypothetical protein